MAEGDLTSTVALVIYPMPTPDLLLEGGTPCQDRETILFEHLALVREMHV